jgi:hypothetical protein
MSVPVAEAVADARLGEEIAGLVGVTLDLAVEMDVENAHYVRVGVMGGASACRAAGRDG